MTIRCTLFGHEWTVTEITEAVLDRAKDEEQRQEWAEFDAVVWCPRCQTLHHPDYEKLIYE